MITPIRPDIEQQSISVRKIRRINAETLLPSDGSKSESAVIDEHRADPVKNIDDIEKISEYLIKNNRLRDNMLFIVGINFGLRVSDLIQLRFSDLINDDLTFKRTFPVFEKKTRNTRKKKQNRYITINDAVMDAVELYLTYNSAKLSDYLFRSSSNNGSRVNQPLSRGSVDRILKGIAEELSLPYHISTHSLRKTFGYHQMLMANHDPRKLVLLQKIFGHSSMMQTLDYIGITQEEIEDAYLNLNLGLNKGLIDSGIGEIESA